QRTLTEADQARLAAEARRLGADSFRERERAMRELRAAGRSALPFVRPAVNHSDPEVARRAERLVRGVGGGPGLAPSRAPGRPGPGCGRRGGPPAPLRSYFASCHRPTTGCSRTN